MSVTNPGGVAPGLVTLTNGPLTQAGQANVTVQGYNSSTIEYAQVIFNHTVTTFSGNNYTWYGTGVTLTTPGSATLQTA